MTRKLTLAVSAVVAFLSGCGTDRYRAVTFEEVLDAGWPVTATGGGASTSEVPCGIEDSQCEFFPGDAGQGPATPQPWAKTFFKRYSFGADVIVDPAGDVVVAGLIVSAVDPNAPFNLEEPPVDFGAGPISVDHPRPFIVKYAADGKLRWARVFRAVEAPVLLGPGDMQAYIRIAIGNDGTIFVAGATLPDRTDFINSDFFLASLTPAGAIRWMHKGVSELKNHEVTSIELDSRGAIWVGGIQGKILPIHGVVAKFSMETGNLLRAFGADNLQPGSIAVLDDQGVVVGGAFNSTVKLDPAPALVSVDPDTYDACLVRLNADAVPVWARSYGTAGGQYVAAVRPDGQGGVFAHGWFTGTLTGMGNLVGTTDSEVDTAFLARVSGDGGTLWSKALKGHQPLASYNLLSVDAQNHVTLGLQSERGNSGVRPTVTLSTFTPLGEPATDKTYTDGVDLFAVSRRGSTMAMGGYNRDETSTDILGLQPDPAGNKYFIAYFPQ